MIDAKNEGACGASLSDAGLGAWPNLDHPAVTIARGRHVYTLSVIDGEVVIDEQTLKEAAIDEIKAQPFYAPNS